MYRQLFSRRSRLVFTLGALTTWFFGGSSNALAASRSSQPLNRLPNIVIIFCDDLGYADIGPFGAKAYKTPHLDQMAAEGRVFTDFHAATAVCSASRAALLTGCYPERVSILGALGPRATHGINANETTLAELCRTRGYATAVFGKWHLGHRKKFLPLQHGFDEYFGLPYSNDMSPLQAEMISGLTDEEKARKRQAPPLPLYEGNKVINSDLSPEQMSILTTQYTERAVDFINRNRNRPFLLYVPHTMVHVPLGVSSKFAGKSGAGLFGDVVMEIDWSVGQILEAIKRNGLDENTLVIFTSDNGPWLNYGNHAGSAGPLREGKGTMWEGGYREPCVMRWPGKIPAGTRCDEFAVTMDIVPTVARLIGAKLPDHRIDGRNIWPLMVGEENAQSPHDAFYCYYDGGLRAVRDRRWKLRFPHDYRSLNGRSAGRDGVPAPYRELKSPQALYDLKSDVGETKDVAAMHPDVVARLSAEAEEARAALGDKLTGRQGSEIRPPDYVKQDQKSGDQKRRRQRQQT
jgi:arylsulfatase A-like enzyme